MHKAIGNRELILLEGRGAQLHGTFHRPADAPGRYAGQLGNPPLGVLFVNSLSLPRAASGDSAVRWADGLAERGYPAFRIDLPGLGDSQGEASTNLLDFINAGGFASVAADAATQLVNQYQLSGVVIFGHCAGAVSAIYAAAATQQCKGLILLDPYFHLPQAKRSVMREQLSGWARRSSVGRFLSNAYDRVRNFALRLRAGAPPGNANANLLTHWKQLAASGLPILMLQAPGIKANGPKPRVGEFNYIEYAIKMAGRKSKVAVEFVEEADHSFANRLGRLAAQERIERWLVSHFPLDSPNSTCKSVPDPRAADNQMEQRNSSTAPANMGYILEGRS